MVFRLIAYKSVANTIAKICSQSPFNEAFLPVKTNATIPIVPINVPISCLFVNFVLNTKNPIMMLKIGVKLFSIPASPEDIPVSA